MIDDDDAFFCCFCCVFVGIGACGGCVEEALYGYSDPEAIGEKCFGATFVRERSTLTCLAWRRLGVFFMKTLIALTETIEFV